MIELAWKSIDSAPKSVADGRQVSGIYILAFVPEPSYHEDEAPPTLESQVCVVWWEPLMKNDKGGRGLWMGEGIYEVHPTQWLCRIDELPAPSAGDVP